MDSFLSLCLGTVILIVIVIVFLGLSALWRRDHDTPPLTETEQQRRNPGPRVNVVTQYTIDGYQENGQYVTRYRSQRDDQRRETEDLYQGDPSVNMPRLEIDTPDVPPQPQVRRQGPNPADPGYNQEKTHRIARGR